MAAGYTVSITNIGSADAIIGRVTSGDTVNGVAQNLRIAPGVSARFRVNAGASGYLIDSVHYPDAGLCEGRLTLTTATPVTTSDVTAATTVYFTPYRGNRIALFDGTAAWSTFAFQELTYTVPSTTSTIYDAFIHNNAGAPAITCTAWTNDTTRATAIALQHGVYVKSGTSAHRYVGSFRTTGTSGQTEDSFAKRYVWNFDNRVTRPLRAVEATASWTYTTATWRQANAATTNQVDFVIGVAEDPYFVNVHGAANNSGANQFAVAVGVNSTSVPSGLYGDGQSSTESIVIGTHKAFPAIGRTFLAWIEWSRAAGTTTWLGVQNAATGQVQSGIQAEIRG